MFSNGDRKMAANMANSTLPKEEVISSLDRRVYRAMTEEVPRKRSRSMEVTPAMLKKSCQFLFFQINSVVAQPGGRGYSLLWAIYVCAAPKGMVFQPFWS